MKTIFKTIFAAAILAGVALAPAAASAPERFEDAAMGTVAGALVAGPVGLMADGVVGYMAGPDISGGINPRNRYQHDDRPFDGSSDGHRNASR